MNVSETLAPAAPTSLAQDWLAAIRHHLGGRRALLVLGGAVVVAGLWFNWSWLVAAGIAPLLLSALPCVAMCALGFCMIGRTGDASCMTERGIADADAKATPGTAAQPDRFTSGLADPTPSPSHTVAAGQSSAVKRETPCCARR